ncbi:hypothetical protein SARC_03022 [Sphaeroforma arctica JP610]|uniref:Uncharacterized protein n=1 Tax=Sphaeroforma arctica JP610 TaxID=667725 RepID=A0A0L0G6Y6_9EUKA|nr:hypothetical protein SARC_03022 [Sphaeroforma arctica JP610]KNC84780.1 hypothetical protein SARC_03022 [Sphaeroforma arctica JP610]|eukprot:XP_014158682.1 hypothetical protein SARC_03022 [Sphaeroforma arctica JP610]
MVTACTNYRDLNDEQLESYKQVLELKAGKTSSTRVLGMNVPIASKNQKALRQCEIEQQRRMFFSDAVDASPETMQQLSDMKSDGSNESIGFPSDIFETNSSNHKKITPETRKLRTQSTTERRKRLMAAPKEPITKPTRSLPVTPSTMPRPGIP